MSYSNEEWRQAITNLLKETSANKLVWKVSDIEEADAWTTVDRSLETRIGKNIFVVSQTRKRHFTDEDSFYWVGDFLFSIFEQMGFGGVEKVATAPEMSALGALFQAADDNVAYNRGALGALLNKSDD